MFLCANWKTHQNHTVVAFMIPSQQKVTRTHCSSGQADQMKYSSLLKCVQLERVVCQVTIKLQVLKPVKGWPATKVGYITALQIRNHLKKKKHVMT